MDEPTTSILPSTDSEEMKANAALRESFLRFMSRLGEKNIEFRTYGDMRLKGKYIALQKNQQHILIDDLCTPTGVICHSALRVRDIVSFTVPASELNK